MQQHHPILELFGKNVQRLRTEQNISQEKLAEKAHHAYQYAEDCECLRGSDR